MIRWGTVFLGSVHVIGTIFWTRGSLSHKRQVIAAVDVSGIRVGGEVALWHSAWLASARVSVRLNRDCCLSSISRVLLKQFKLFNFVAWLVNTLIRHCLLILYCIVWLQDDISEVVWNAWCLLVLESPCIACGCLRKLIFHLEKLYITILGLDHWWLVVRVWNRRVDALKVMSLHVKSLTLVDLGGLVVAHARWLANRVVDALDEVLVVKQIWWC